MVRTLFSYILSPIFYICFGFCLAIFHPIQWLSLKLGGYSAHKKSVDVLNWFLTRCYHLLGNSVTFINKQNLPTNRPIIFVSNHQSQYDIPPLIYFLRKHHGKFISKIELTKGIPSVSFNLKYGGAANINRKDSEQSKREIARLARDMKEKNWSAFIFPEGTRTKDGKMKEFALGGISTIIQVLDHALIVPVAIEGSYQMTKKGIFPLRAFTKMRWEVLTPIEANTENIVAKIKEAETAIRSVIEK